MRMTYNYNKIIHIKTNHYNIHQISPLHNAYYERLNEI